MINLKERIVVDLQEKVPTINFIKPIVSYNGKVALILQGIQESRQFP